MILVAVNTSMSYIEPSGKLVVVHRNNRQIIAEHELGGQPDSIALAPERKRAAIVIENKCYIIGEMLLAQARDPSKINSVTPAKVSPS